MDDFLKGIDQNLINLEETLLMELRRLRKQPTEEVYTPIEPTLKKELKINFNATVQTLEGSGDWGNLSLKSFEQEWIEDRLKVVRNLLVRKLPTAFLALSHEEHKQTRKSDFATDDHQASQELAILDEQVGLHHVEGQTIDQIIKDRAQFDSRELTHGHATAKVKREIAQSPEEIRRKLEGKSGSSGASSFSARDIDSLNDTMSGIPRKNIARSPEEIRRKLQEKGAAASRGASSFAAKDLTSSNPRPEPIASKPAADIAQNPEEIKRKLAERKASGGKAVFGSKDIQSAAPPPVVNKKSDSEKKNPDPKPGGKAIFESRDLSDPNNK